MNKNGSFLHYLPLIGLLLFLAAWFVYGQVLYPMPTGQNYDPEMAYLFSSLNLVKGQPVVYIDHPGTPVQILGALVLAATYPLAKMNGAAFIEFTLRHPNLFLVLARGLLVVLNCAAAWFIFRTFARRRTWQDALLGASIAALYFVIHPMALTMSTVWSHNSFNYSAGALLLLWMYRVSIREKPARWVEILGLGLASGVLTAVTIYLGCWVIGIALTLSIAAIMRREKFWRLLLLNLGLAAASAAGFVLATLPILSQYPRFFAWVNTLLIHQGRYGAGEVGWISSAEFASRLRDMLAAMPLFWLTMAVVLILCVLLLIGWKRSDQAVKPGATAFIAGVFVQLLLNILIIAKHPGLVYMLSTAATLTVLAGAVVEVQFRKRAPANRFAWFTGLVLLALLSFTFVYQTARPYKARRDGILTGEAMIQKEIASAAAANGVTAAEMRVLRTYGLYSTCFGFWFGNDYAGTRFTADVQKICPGDYSLVIFNGEVSSLGSFSPAEWDLVISRESFLNYSPLAYAQKLAIKRLPYAVNDSYGSLVIIPNPDP